MPKPSVYITRMIHAESMARLCPYADVDINPEACALSKEALK